MNLPKDTAQDRGLDVCKEKRDAVLSALKEAGKLMQDGDIAVSNMVEMLAEDSRGLCVGRTAEKEGRVCVSYKSPAMHVIERISVVQTMTVKVDPGECRHMLEIH